VTKKMVTALELYITVVLTSSLGIFLRVAGAHDSFCVATHIYFKKMLLNFIEIFIDVCQSNLKVLYDLEFFALLCEINHPTRVN
jgi:hypothetical protein